MISPRLTLALTGGIASGKSAALELLKRAEPGLHAFDCDLEVRQLLGRPEVQRHIADALGQALILPGGGLDRDRLRSEVFGDPAKRKLLEGILHPLVRQECLARHAEWSKSEGSSLFVADVPLLFKNDFSFPYDASVTVAVSRETQMERVRRRNGFDDKHIEQILAAQLDTGEKMRRADHVLWNEGPLEGLAAQITLLIKTLR